VLTASLSILDCQIDFNTLFRTLNLLQNLLLNNELTEQHTRGLTVYAHSVMEVISRESHEMTQADYKHLFLDLVFKLQLPVHGRGSDFEGIINACQICVNS
jgi:hypothetical protein